MVVVGLVVIVREGKHNSPAINILRSLMHHPAIVVARTARRRAVWVVPASTQASTVRVASVSVVDSAVAVALHLPRGLSMLNKAERAVKCG